MVKKAKTPVVAILAGGMGTRLAEETDIRPKPMVEIGDRPILWHIMKLYAHYGFNEFVIAMGYKGEYIKRWMRDYGSLEGHMTVKTNTGDVLTYEDHRPDWTVHLVETGMQEMGLVLRYCTVNLVINPFFNLMGLNSFLELMITLTIHPKV